jgi:ankyrin repeat protein
MRIMLRQHLHLPQHDWDAVQNELDTFVGESKNWRDLDLDENYVDWQTTFRKFSEIETVVLAAKAGKNKSPQSSWTLLHWAAHCNKTWPISQFLLDTEHVDVMALDSEGRTALDVALAGKCNAAIKMLQAHITQNKLVTKAEKQALEQAQALALQQAETKRQAKALQEAKALADTKIEQARIAAEKTAREKIEQAEKERLANEARAKNEAELTLKNATPNLFKAILARDISDVNLVLTQGADIHGQDSEEFFPILRAAQVGDVDILKLLISNGADANTSHSITNHSALYEAALNNQKAAALFLLEQGAEPDFVNFADETPMHGCARSGAIEIAQALHLRGVDLDARNEKNQTPLILAVLAGNKTNKANIVFVKWLLEQQVQWDIIDSDGKTALDYSKGADKGAAYNELSKLKKQGGYKTRSNDSSGKQESPTHPAQKPITPPKPESTPASPSTGMPASSASFEAKLKAEIPGLDEQGGIRVQFTIPYTKLEFGKILGEGGFGVVHQGKYAHTDVAIKCIQTHKLTEHALEELKTESLFMVQLKHPNVVQCYGACLEPGHYSLVMELMPKGSLYDLLQNKQEISWSLRAQIAVDIASGLAYLHDQQIVHRDLKSMNVLLSDNLRAKISDFGLSKIKTASQATTANTKKGIGTTRWMAPELFDDEPSNTVASDVYSFGMVLWELTARKIPYEKLKTDAQVTRAIDKGQKEIIPEDCPPELSQTITACWETKPKHRLTSSQAAEQLSAWCCLFKTESQQLAVGTKTAMMNKLDEIAAGVKLGIQLQIPPIPSLTQS